MLLYVFESFAFIGNLVLRYKKMYKQIFALRMLNYIIKLCWASFKIITLTVISYVYVFIAHDKVQYCLKTVNVIESYEDSR